MSRARRTDVERTAAAIVAAILLALIALLHWPAIVAAWRTATLLVLACAWLLFVPLADCLPENQEPRR